MKYKSEQMIGGSIINTASREGVKVLGKALPFT